MDPESQTIVQETFNRLPQDIQDMIFADEYPVTLAAISKKYNLSSEQIIKFELETTLTLMGLEELAYYQFNLEFELGIGEDEAEGISKEVNDTVFSEVEESLEKMRLEALGDQKTLDAKLDYEEKKAEELTPLAATAAPVVNPAMTSLSDRLKQASIATPSKREYSISRAAENAAGTEILPRTIDPYHESIDNE